MQMNQISRLKEREFLIIMQVLQVESIAGWVF